MNEIEKSLMAIEDEQREHFVKQVNFKVDEGYLDKLPRAIIANFDEVAKFITQQTATDRRMVLTEDDITSAKDRCAVLNKQAKAIAECRSNVKQMWERPYNEFATKCKQLEQLVLSAKDNLWSQVKKFEEDSILKREDEYVLYFESKMGEELLHYRHWEQIKEKTWFNKSFSRQKVIDAIDAKVIEIRAEVAAIKSLNSEFEVSLLHAYAEGKSLTQVMKLNSDLQAEKQSNSSRNDSPNVNSREDTKQSHISEKTTLDDVNEYPVELVELSLKLTLERKHLPLLKAFFKENGIQYERIAKGNVDGSD